MELHRLAAPNLIFADVPGSDAATVLKALSGLIAAGGVVKDADTLYRKLDERERLGSTGIGNGVAVPHCKLKKLDRVVMAIGTSRSGVDFAAVDGEPVRLFFVVLSPEKDPAAHLQSLASISKWVKANRHVERILLCTDADAILTLLREGGGET